VLLGEIGCASLPVLDLLIDSFSSFNQNAIYFGVREISVVPVGSQTIRVVRFRFETHGVV